MLDLIAIIVIGWTVILGVFAGPFRMLMFAAALTGSFFVVTKTAYWIEPTLHSPLIAQAFRVWLLHLMDRVIPVMQVTPALSTGVHIYTPLFQYLRSLYVQIISFLYALGAGTALLIAFRSMHTIWPSRPQRYPLQQIGGALLGLCTGFYSVLCMVQWLMTYVFVVRNSTLLYFLHHSLLVHAWTVMQLHGIVERL